VFAETLRSLAAAVAGTVTGDASVAIADVTHDSRQARPGSLFVAIPGGHVDGHNFVQSAIDLGASAVAVERPVAVDVPVLALDSSRARLGRLAARVHGEPSKDLSVVGITGTNGKTTVAHLCESIFLAGGLRPGRMGTTGAVSGDQIIQTGHTTPEASEVHRLLATMRADGVDAVAMEVSSHALALGRVEEVEFEAAAFTNLSQDHLDFHTDMEDYFAAKRELFYRAPRAVVAVDGEWGRRLISEMPRGVEAISVGEGAAIQATGVAASLDGSEFQLHMGDEIRTVRLPLAGSFNVANALVAAGLATVLDLSVEAIVEGLSACPQVPGRFEVIRSSRGTIVVDYAHTPDAIEVAIADVRRLASGKVIAVFGAGGDRDPHKRPLMGAAGCRADLAIVTNDNPRSEDPQKIADEVLAGMPADCDVAVELDRRRALELALHRSTPSDTILLLGKGHEPDQAFADRIEPFDDRLEAARVLELPA